MSKTAGSDLFVRPHGSTHELDPGTSIESMRQHRLRVSRIISRIKSGYGDPEPDDRTGIEQFHEALNERRQT